MSEISNSAAPVPSQPLPAWKIWANPIWRRYARARLRTKHLVIWLTLTLLPASFIFFGIQVLVLYRAQLPIDNAGRAQFLFLFGLQATILFTLGTGQSAGGITAEADEGMLEYQRLTPLTPLAKVFGYLFGLPIREYVMVLATVPYTIFAIWSGSIPARIWVPLYLVFLSATILYHLTGLVAGTVVKNRRWAFLVSIAIVILLYTVVPQLSKFGLVFFKYLAILPSAIDGFGKLADESALGVVRSARAITQHAPSPPAEVRFAGLIFPLWAFTLLTQGAFILTFIAMLWRRWRREESHLLGKLWAVGLFAWTQVLLLGSSLPLIESGLLFPSREIRRRVLSSAGNDWAPSLTEAVIMIAGYGLATMCILFVLTNIITATEDEQLRGFRRARKLGWARVPALSDPAGSFWFVAVMAVAGALGWMFFARGIVESSWFSGIHFPAHGVWTFALVLLTSGLGYQTMLEAGGGRWPFFAAVFVGVIPLMVGMILSWASNSFLTASTWLGGMSPLSAPIYAVETLIPASLPVDVATALPRAFWFWQIIGALVVACLIVQLRRVRNARALLAMLPPEVPPALPLNG